MPTTICFRCTRCGIVHEADIYFGQIGNPVYDFKQEHGIVSTDFGDLCAGCGKIYAKEKYRAEKVAESWINENFWKLKTP